MVSASPANAPPSVVFRFRARRVRNPYLRFVAKCVNTAYSDRFARIWAGRFGGIQAAASCDRKARTYTKRCNEYGHSAQQRGDIKHDVRDDSPRAAASVAQEYAGRS